MKVGDIIFFKFEFEYITNSTASGGIINYLHKPGDRYLINVLPSSWYMGEIVNLEDSTRHFITLSIMNNQMITSEEQITIQRECQLNKILNHDEENKRW